jgi:8-oxo-dGTP pyrophosphatase MutT (NUDIX family)
MYAEVVRFKDLRPKNTDTNLFTYHLKNLVKTGMVQKTEGGYMLGPIGLSYVDRVSAEKKIVRTQPKVITMLVIQNSDGQLLLQRRNKQPYINEWTLPYGKLHIDDASILIAAQRECLEKLGIQNARIEHAGDCYIRVQTKGELLSTTLTHVFRMFTDDITASDSIQWIQPHKLSSYRLAPAVEEVTARTFFKDPHFFEEFVVERS